MVEWQVGQTVYVTKYALTKGILTKRVREVAESARYLFLKVEGEQYSIYDPTRREVHATMDAAQAEARAMAERKIASLRKQMSKAMKIASIGAKVVPLPEEK